MPVPVYAPITDAEVSPEAPITSSLMFRLRDNFLAILGIDNTNPAPVFQPPPYTYTPSAKVELISVISSFTSRIDTLAEVSISDVTKSDWLMPRNQQYFTGLAGSLPYPVSYVFFGHLDNFCGANVVNMNVIWAAGTPTDVHVDGRVFGDAMSPGSVFSFDVPIDNAWHNLTYSERTGIGHVYVDMKARLDGNLVKVQFRTQTTNNGTGAYDGPILCEDFIYYEYTKK